MPKSRKIAGIYKITNKRNGKVYIGQSSNIRQRIKQYIWGATSDRDYSETKHPITVAVRNEGLDNFEFSVLEAGSEFDDAIYRGTKEIEYIAKYRACDPEYGYNEDNGGGLGHLMPRKQEIPERYRRANPIITYDIETGHTLLYLSGANGLAKQLGYERTIITRNIKRGSIIAGKFYAFYAHKELRDEVLKHLKEAKLDTPPLSDDLRAIENKSRSIRSYHDYMEVAKKMDQIASEYGF